MLLSVNSSPASLVFVQTLPLDSIIWPLLVFDLFLDSGHKYTQLLFCENRQVKLLTCKIFLLAFLSSYVAV